MTDEAGLSVPAPPDKEPESPKTEEKVRPRRTKEALKEQLREKKREKKVKEMVSYPTVNSCCCSFRKTLITF